VGRARSTAAPGFLGLLMTLLSFRSLVSAIAVPREGSSTSSLAAVSSVTSTRCPSRRDSAAPASPIEQIAPTIRVQVHVTLEVRRAPLLRPVGRWRQWPGGEAPGAGQEPQASQPAACVRRSDGGPN